MTKIVRQANSGLITHLGSQDSHIYNKVQELYKIRYKSEGRRSVGGSYAKRAVGYRAYTFIVRMIVACVRRERCGARWDGLGQGRIILSDEGRPAVFSHDNLCFSLMLSGRLVERRGGSGMCFFIIHTFLLTLYMNQSSLKNVLIYWYSVI